MHVPHAGNVSRNSRRLPGVGCFGADSQSQLLAKCNSNTITFSLPPHTTKTIELTQSPARMDFSSFFVARVALTLYAIPPIPPARVVTTLFAARVATTLCATPPARVATTLYAARVVTTLSATPSVKVATALFATPSYTPFGAHLADVESKTQIRSHRHSAPAPIINPTLIRGHPMTHHTL